MMKPPVSTSTRRRVLDLRRSHSLSQVAERTGLPVGTVKTICSRSGSFRDNPKHHGLFSLPPIQPSGQTLPAIPELPPKPQSITGDDEVDSVLWLRQIISTGQAALIEKAFEAVKRIQTPLKDLEERYTKHLVSQNPGNFAAAFSSFGFADIEGLAKRSIEKSLRRIEGSARFGNTLFQDTPAEQFCIDALAGLKCMSGDFDKSEVAVRFNAHPEVMPHTLSDCLHELTYWDELSGLRHAHGTGCDDGTPEGNARDWFVFGCLASIRPRSNAESVAVFRYLADSDRMEQSEANDILLNLLGGGKA